jgi:hypothetical protein
MNFKVLTCHGSFQTSGHGEHGVDFMADVSGAELTEASCCTQTDSRLD